jgi:hypothetical protein
MMLQPDVTMAVVSFPMVVQIPQHVTLTLQLYVMTDLAQPMTNVVFAVEQELQVVPMH